MNGLWWLAVVMAPVLGAMCLWYRPRTTIPWLWVTCAPALLAAFQPPAALVPAWLWPGAEWGATDDIRRIFLALTGLVWGCATVFAAARRPAAGEARFWLFWLLALTGNLLAVISRDGPGFYVGFSIMSLSAYGLVVHPGGREQRRAGRIYLQMALAGEMLLFAGLTLRIHETGSVNLGDWQAHALPPLTGALLIAGFGIKMGFWPLHLWLPPAYRAAPAPGAAVLSGSMMKVGVLGLWLFMPEAGPWLRDWTPWLLALGAVSAFYGVMAGLLQRDAQTVLAYSSVSQAGYLLVIQALAWHQPAVRESWGLLLAFFAVHHATAKSALFLGAGLAGNVRLGRWHWLLMALPALALAGLPPTTGMVVKNLIKKGLADDTLEAWIPLLSLGSLATGLLVLHALWRMYRAGPAPGEGDKAHPLRVYPWAVLSLAPLVLPWLWPAMNEPWRKALAPDALWSAIWPLLVAGGIAALAMVRGWRPPGRLAYRLGPGLSLSSGIIGVLNRLSLPALEYAGGGRWWRQWERRWNRLWRETNPITLSGWLLFLLLLLGWLW